jgi:hypothetical protein
LIKRLRLEENEVKRARRLHNRRPRRVTPKENASNLVVDSYSIRTVSVVRVVEGLEVVTKTGKMTPLKVFNYTGPFSFTCSTISSTATVAYLALLQ